MNIRSNELVLKEYKQEMSQIKKIIIVKLLAISLMFFSGCVIEAGRDMAGVRPVPLEVITAGNISVPVYDFQGLKPMLEQQNDTVYIMNFWATWCKPCVKEMPYFQEADSAFAGLPVRIVLISLDFAEDVKDILIPFIVEKGIVTEVVLLDDINANSWIPQVDPHWEGDIPATLFIYGKERIFRASSFTYEEIADQVHKLLNL